jgi:hypothetical protein
MARHVAVIAINSNPDAADGWVAPYFFDAARALTGGTPILLSEWFFAADQNRTGNSNSGHLMTVATQAERAAGAAAFTRNVARIPEVLGLHWFQWADHPKGGRGDGEDYNFGLVDLLSHPYETLTAALTAANRAAPRLHADAAPGLGGRDMIVPNAAIRLGDSSLAEWPKPQSLLPPMVPQPGNAIFGEAYLAWNGAGLYLATIGQDYYDIDLFDRTGPFPPHESYRLELDLGGVPFTLAFVPPAAKVRDHPPMEVLLCRGQPRPGSGCEEVPSAKADYFGADQPRIAAEIFLPWSALGTEGPPTRLPIAIRQFSWHGGRTMTLEGTLALEKMSPPTKGELRAAGTRRQATAACWDCP